MMSFLKRIKARLFGAHPTKNRNRAIRRECDTLRRWSERGNSDRFNV